MGMEGGTDCQMTATASSKEETEETSVTPVVSVLKNTCEKFCDGKLSLEAFKVEFQKILSSVLANYADPKFAFTSFKLIIHHLVALVGTQGFTISDLLDAICEHLHCLPLRSVAAFIPFLETQRHTFERQMGTAISKAKLVNLAVALECRLRGSPFAYLLTTVYLLVSSVIPASFTGIANRKVIAHGKVDVSPGLQSKLHWDRLLQLDSSDSPFTTTSVLSAPSTLSVHPSIPPTPNTATTSASMGSFVPPSDSGSAPKGSTQLPLTSSTSPARSLDSQSSGVTLEDGAIEQTDYDIYNIYHHLSRDLQNPLAWIGDKQASHKILHDLVYILEEINSSLIHNLTSTAPPAPSSHFTGFPSSQIIPALSRISSPLKIDSALSYYSTTNIYHPCLLPPPNISLAETIVNERESVVSGMHTANAAGEHRGNEVLSSSSPTDTARDRHAVGQKLPVSPCTIEMPSAKRQKISVQSFVSNTDTHKKRSVDDAQVSSESSDACLTSGMCEAENVVTEFESLKDEGEFGYLKDKKAHIPWHETSDSRLKELFDLSSCAGFYDALKKGRCIDIIHFEFLMRVSIVLQGIDTPCKKCDAPLSMNMSEVNRRLFDLAKQLHTKISNVLTPLSAIIPPMGSSNHQTPRPEPNMVSIFWDMALANSATCATFPSPYSLYFPNPVSLAHHISNPSPPTITTTMSNQNNSTTLDASRSTPNGSDIRPVYNLLFSPRPSERFSLKCLTSELMSKESFAIRWKVESGNDSFLTPVTSDVLSPSPKVSILNLPVQPLHLSTENREMSGGSKSGVSPHDKKHMQRRAHVYQQLLTSYPNNDQLANSLFLEGSSRPPIKSTSPVRRDANNIFPLELFPSFYRESVEWFGKTCFEDDTKMRIYGQDSIPKKLERKFQDYLAKIQMDADPSNAIDLEERALNSNLFLFRCNRLLASLRPEIYWNSRYLVSKVVDQIGKTPQLTPTSSYIP